MMTDYIQDDRLTQKMKGAGMSACHQEYVSPSHHQPRQVCEAQYPIRKPCASIDPVCWTKQTDDQIVNALHCN